MGVEVLKTKTITNLNEILKESRLLFADSQMVIIRLQGGNND